MEEKYVPTIRKPEHVCFWCGKETLTDEMLDECFSDFSRYYLRCPNCHPEFDQKNWIRLIEAVDFPVLIDQPMYDGQYPTGPNCRASRKEAVEGIRVITNGAVDATNEEEVLLSPAAYSLVTGQPLNYNE